MRAVRSRRPLTRTRTRVDLRGTYNDTRSELRKITWPTREETIRLSLVVIALSLALALFLGLVVDQAFFWLYSRIIGL